MQSPETLKSWSHGEWLSPAPEHMIGELCIDSRKINKPEAAAFFAIKSARRDGHDFLKAAYDAGVRLLVVSEKILVGQFPNAGVLLVKDTILALQLIASKHRNCFQIPVVGITGSNGKTIVKEWLYQALAADYNIARNPKSYNSQIGVPLSVWMIKPESTLGIFEAGISQPGEMEALEKIIRPNIGIFTNIGAAHSEGFLNQRQKINEKLLLFRHTETIIYCRDYTELHECITTFVNNTKSDTEPEKKLITWSYKGDASMLISEKREEAHTTLISATYKGESIDLSIPFTDAASIENAIQVWCCMLHLGYKNDLIKSRLLTLQPIEMRLETRRGIGGSTVINDSYNSDITSLAISLDYLEGQRQHSRRTVILSDILQMGRPDSELYDEVAAMLLKRRVKRFIGVGPALYRHKSAFRAHKGLRSIFFKSTADFLKNFHHLSFENEAILLKGARPFLFEKIAALLDEEVHQTVLAISLPALRQNLNAFRSKIGPKVKLMAMVKAFSYGSGSHEIAGALQDAGVDYLTVAYTDEGITLRKAGITLPIMVMSPELSAIDRMIAWKLEPEIYNFRSLEAFIGVASTFSMQHYPIHIKLDTGMHRLGFHKEDISKLIDMLLENNCVEVASIFSHLAAAESSAMDMFTEKQAILFEEMSQKLIGNFPKKPLLHLCNTAAIGRHPNLHYDMVRLGLGLYGIDTGNFANSELQPISSLTTSIAQINEISADEGIGYGHQDAKNQPRRIATISVGYADGYPRTLGHGKAHVLIHEKPAPLVGVVCMDMCMVDITDIPEAHEGDRVLVFGPQLPLTQLAHWAETIPYELMTGISARVKRVFVEE
ncbi:MAG: bifunctional UDP-N-acetylmuramoyl-tripeptide:D-alanyl-D-alanine ligase/alanine racemase [Chitinophagaceae bacterium]